MNFLYKNKKLNSQSTAEVVDNHLILSAPNAIDPVMWRMSLEKIGTAAFEVKSDNDTEKFKLLLKPKKGTAEIIAVFSSKEEAVEALIASSNAMQSAINLNASSSKSTIASDIADHKSQNNAHITSNAPRKQGSGRWFIVLMGLVIVSGLYFYLNTLMPTTTAIGQSTSQSSNIITDPSQTIGKPVSADDFLNSLQ